MDTPDKTITLTTGTRGQPGYKAAKKQLEDLIARGWKPTGGTRVDISFDAAGTFDRISFDQIVLVITRFQLPADNPGTLALPIGRAPREQERFVEQARKHLLKKGWILADNAPVSPEAESTA